MKALDLFCGAGGASRGVVDAGFEVVGIDLNPQRHYPFEFHQSNALSVTLKYLRQFDFIWASPPCQAYSVASAIHRKNGKKYPDLVAVTRDMLIESGIPYAIENVGGAPLQNPIMLCGTMFGLGVFRHRYFELSWGMLSPHHDKHKGKIGDGKYFSIAGGAGRWRSWGTNHKGISKGTIAQWKTAMDIGWMTRDEIKQAIPPSYSKWIAEQFLKTIK